MNIIVSQTTAILMAGKDFKLVKEGLLLNTGAKLKQAEEGYYYVHGYTPSGRDAIKAIHDCIA